MSAAGVLAPACSDSSSASRANCLGVKLKTRIRDSEQESRESSMIIMIIQAKMSNNNSFDRETHTHTHSLTHRDMKRSAASISFHTNTQTRAQSEWRRAPLCAARARRHFQSAYILNYHNRESCSSSRSLVRRADLSSWTPSHLHPKEGSMGATGWSSLLLRLLHSSLKRSRNSKKLTI